jgi:hypothetical protein
MKCHAATTLFSFLIYAFRQTIFLIICLGLAARVGSTATPIAGNIVSNTTWQAAASPYLVSGSTTVVAGATLTIEPGVEIDFGQYGALYVLGTLVATGAAAQPILFTGVTKAPGSWGGVQISGTNDAINALCRLEYVVIEYGGGVSQRGNLSLEWANPFLRNVVLRYGSGDGIYGRIDTGGHYYDVQSIGNSGWAFYFHDAAFNPEFLRLTATGNGKDAVAFDQGSISGLVTWRNAGLPLTLLGGIYVESDSTLTIEPGVELRFSQHRGMNVNGRLLATGTAQQPIKFTGTSATKGWWAGLSFNGYEAAPCIGSRLDYVTIEYAGADGGADIYAFYAQIAISHSIIRLSAGDGIFVKLGGDGVSIQSSQIVQNDSYGIRNADPQNTVVSAPNNWWGDDSGPRSEYQCTAGTGSAVSGGVAFLPVLSSAGGNPSPFSPGNTYTLTLEPDRWFVPADGVLRSNIVATVRDGAGQPVPGRVVKATATVGTLMSGGTTDVKGQTYIMATSDTPGDAVVTGSIDRATDPCLLIRPASTMVTFTPIETPAAGELTPDSESSYTTADISVGPKPLMRGRPAVFTVKLTNPFSLPILVNAVLGSADLGVGLLFGPIHTWEDVRIEPHATQILQAPYTPAVEGHWCFDLDYSWREAAGANISAQRASRHLDFSNDGPSSKGGKRFARVNENTDGSSVKKTATNSSDNASKAGNQARESGMGACESINNRSDTAAAVGAAMMGSEEHWTGPGRYRPKKEQIVPLEIRHLPQTVNRCCTDAAQSSGEPLSTSQDYMSVVRPVKPFVPVYRAGDENLTATQATSLNTLLDALADVIGYGRAVIESNFRYDGAVQADEPDWAAQQTAAVLYYQQQAGLAYLKTADALQHWLDVFPADEVRTVAEVVALQQRLQSSGFTADEINHYTALGCTDDELEWIRQTFTAADPAEKAGSLRFQYAQIVAAYRDFGNSLAYPEPTFPEQMNQTGDSYAAPSVPPPPLAQVYDVERSIEIGNPLSTTATIELKVRKIGMPADWSVLVSPSTLTLAPGEQQTVSVRISPPGVSVQGTAPRVAVEGYANGSLIGGVAFTVVVPKYVPFQNTGPAPSVPLYFYNGGAATTSTAGSDGGVQAGYATLDVTSGDAPYGTAVFSLKQNNTVVSEVGVPASTPSKSVRIFVDFRTKTPAAPGQPGAGTLDINTGVAVVNPGSAAANVTYTLRGVDGQTLAAGHGTLAAAAHFAKFINQLKDVAPDFSLPANFDSATGYGSLQISSDQALSILPLRLTTNQRGETIITSTPAADLTQPFSTAPAYFPQFSDGGGYVTTILLLNTSNATETGRLSILDDNGSPVVVRQAGGSSDSSFPYSIPAGGIYILQTDGSPSAVKTGFVRLTPDGGTSTPAGSAIFRYSRGGTVVTESGVAATVPTTHARVFVDKSGGHDTGLAIANPAASGSNILLKSFQLDGATAAGSGTASLPLTVNGHKAAFVGQMISGLPEGFTGILDISSAAPFVVLTLRSLTNERGDFLLTTFPTADLNRPAPTPIIFPQIADGGGYTTQFILLSASGAANTTLNFLGDTGKPLAVGK